MILQQVTTEPKRLKCRYKGRTEFIPDVWLLGRSRTRQKEGLSHGDAYTQAIIDWFEQSELERAYRRQEHPCPTP